MRENKTLSASIDSELKSAGEETSAVCQAITRFNFTLSALSNGINNLKPEAFTWAPS